MSRHLDIDLLRTFVAIAETRTLAGAAGRIGRTQAAVSMQVQKLEALVNQPLLVRTGRGVVPTLHGERLLVHARTILRVHDEAVSELSGTGLAGTLRFGCPDDYAAAFLPQVLQGFASRHPQVLIEVVCAPTPRLLDRLKSHALNMALISVPTVPGNDAGADVGPGALKVIRHEPLVWAGKPGSNAPQAETLQLALSDPDTLDHRAARQALTAASRPFRVAYASGSLAGLTAVVRSGMAIAVLTRAAVPPDLDILPTGADLPTLPSVGLALTYDLEQPPAIAVAFGAYLESALPTL